MKFFEQWGKLGEAMVEMPFVAVRSMFAQDRGTESGTKREKICSRRDGRPTTPGCNC